MFSTFTATNPSLYLDIDRDKAQALGLSISDVFTALQATLGGIYVNDFNLFGRTWQVNIEGEPADRSDISAIWRIYVRNKNGDDGAAALDRQPADRDRAAGDHPVQQLPLGHHQWRPAPGVSSGDALAAMAEISERTLPPGYGFEWTGTAYQEQLAAGQTGLILGLAVLFAYLFLVALYESWTIPMPVLLSVVVGVLGAYRRHPDRRAVARSLRADRPGGADRAGRQERHPDRRIRQGAARGGHADPRGGGAGRAHAVPRRDDDLDGVHPRSDAAGLGARRGAAEPARRSARRCSPA